MTGRSRAIRRLRVVVVDGDRRVRDSLAELLGLGDELEVVGRAAHGGDALELCAEAAPDVVVIDPRLPDPDSGRALIEELRRRFPATAVLVLSWPGDGDGEDRPIDGLVDGFVPKSDPPSELVSRIVELAGGAGRRTAGGADRASGRC
ncbi:MAG TPA: response regulator transcription factor [Candidatus Limnocylindrales bacterium]|nr:response regulator transcription factor [Candidatus Limnocylindrales bacterium]